MPEVRETPSASRSASALRGPNRVKYEAFLDQLADKGCAALDYRLSGELIERLCVRHIRAQIRAVVAFVPEDDTAWVLLVGEHTDRELQVYELLYAITGERPDTLRSKPPCCDEDGAAPVVEESVLSLLVRHTRTLPRASARR